MALPGPDRLSYRGLSFDTLFSVKVTAKPQFNDSGRATKWVAHTLRASGWIVGDSEVPETDARMQSMRQMLTEPGGTLRFTGRGYSDLNVNVPGGLKDLNFGPTPTVLEWTPRGDARGAFVVWEVTTCIPEQPNPKQGSIIAYDYSVGYAIDREGLTTVTTSGYCEIGMTRTGADNRNPPDCVDLYRRLVTPPPIKGFLREHQWQISQDRRRLEFTFTDRQLPFALIPGTSAVRATQRTSSGMSRGFSIWTSSIDCTVRVPPHQSKQEAYSLMLLVCLSRMSGMKVNGGQVNVPGAPQKRTSIITDIQLTNELFDSQFSFSFSWQDLGASLNELVGGKSGFFAPVNDKLANFDTWTASHSRTFDAYGSAGIGLTQGSDFLLDPGTRQQPKMPSYNPKLDRDGKGDKKLIPKQAIDKDHSWIFFTCDCIYNEEWRVVDHIPLGGVQAVIQGPFAIGAKLIGLGGVIPAINAAAAAGAKIVKKQLLGEPRATLRLVGRAIRLEHPILRPTIASIGGVNVGPGDQDVKLKDITFKTKPFGLGISGVTCFMASWDLLFSLPMTLGPDFAANSSNVVLNLDGNL